MKLSVRLCWGVALLLFVAITAVSFGQEKDKAAKRPNIIFIMADDK